MSTLKILAVVAAVFGLLGIGTVVRQTATNADHCQACNDSDCQFCLDDAACDEGACASGECSGQCDASTAFAFEHEAPACSACAHEASTAPDGEVVPGDVTETGELASETSERSIVTVTDATFANYVNAETGTVLVDFYADWCGPCKVQGAILADYVRNNPTVTIVKVNVDESPKLAARFEITGIPALKVYQGEELSAAHVGVADARSLDELLGLAR